MSADPPARCVDHGDADAGADDDGMAADRVGRAQRPDHAARDLVQRAMVRRRGGDHGELIATQARNKIVAAHDMRKPQCHIADELVTDRMAERIVDVLEVIEVDVKHRHRCAAASDVGDHRLQPLAEEIPVRQAAQRVVQREIAQPVLARNDGCRCGAHVTHHEPGEQRKARKRNGDEGHNGSQDRGARLLRQPGDLRDRLIAAVGECVGVVAGQVGAVVDHPKVGELEAIANAGEHALIDGSDRQHERRRASRRCRRAASQ